MAALANSYDSLVTLPDGTLVPASGGGLVNVNPVSPAAAAAALNAPPETNDIAASSAAPAIAAGALNGALIPRRGAINASAAPAIAAALLNNSGERTLARAINAAGASGAVSPSGALPGDNVVALNTHRFHPRQPGSILRMPTPVPKPQDDNGAALGALVAGIAKKAGVIGGAPTGAIPDVTVTPAVNDPSQQGGMFDKLMNFFHGDKASTQAANAAPPLATSDVPGAAAPSAQPADATQDDYFTRLQKNPLALALVTGGLSMLGRSSAPGTFGDALSNGALTGINAVYDQRVAQQNAELAAIKAKAEADKDAAQGNLYTAQAGAIPDETTAKGKTADAALANAKANAARAAAGRYSTLLPGSGIDPATGQTVNGVLQANLQGGAPQFYPGFTVTGGPGNQPTGLEKNAQFLVRNGVAKDIGSAVKMLRSGVNNSVEFNRLVQSEKKILQSSPDGAGMSDADLEKMARANVRSRVNSAAEDMGAGALPSPGAGGRGGALPTPQALRQQAQAAIARGANPATVKARLKAMGGDPTGL
jgi:hypothetical protein